MREWSMDSTAGMWSNKSTRDDFVSTFIALQSLLEPSGLWEGETMKLRLVKSISYWLHLTLDLRRQILAGETRCLTEPYTLLAIRGMEYSVHLTLETCAGLWAYLRCRNKALVADGIAPPRSRITALKNHVRAKDWAILSVTWIWGFYLCLRRFWPCQWLFKSGDEAWDEEARSSRDSEASAVSTDTLSHVLFVRIDSVQRSERRR